MIMKDEFISRKNDEIIECLTDAGIDVSSNELLEPNRHKDKVKSIFTDLVSHVYLFYCFIVPSTILFSNYSCSHLSLSLCPSGHNWPQSSEGHIHHNNVYYCS